VPYCLVSERAFCVKITLKTVKWQIKKQTKAITKSHNYKKGTFAPFAEAGNSSVPVVGVRRYALELIVKLPSVFASH
jgi:hypothetical protein